MKKKIAYILIAIYTFCLLTLSISPLAISSSAISEYNGKIYKYIGGSITVSSTPYISNLPAGCTYTLNDGIRAYNQLRVTTESRAVGNAFEAYQSSTGTATALVIGDVLYFDRDMRNITLTAAWRSFLNDCCELVPIWQSDDSSPYSSIYSTIGHFVFNDDYTNVPFGEYWVSGIAILACVFVLVMPFLIVYFIIRRL